MKITKKIEKTAVFAWSSVLMFSGMILAQLIPAISGLYATFVTGIVGLATAFFAGHVTSQWVASKDTPKDQPGASKSPVVAPQPPVKHDV